MKSRLEEAPRKKVVIDTDGGADDVRAISLALQTNFLEILAITTVHGVVSIEQVIINISRTLRANGKNVPVYKGAAEPLVLKKRQNETEPSFFGRDGIGDQPKAFPEVTPNDASNFEKDKPAAMALVELFNKNDDVTLICIGPLTNVALAMILDQEFKKRPKEIIILGGNLYGVGNMISTSTAEYNFANDPEAAHMILSKMEVPITLIPWEVFFFNGKKLEKEVDFHANLKYQTPLSSFLSMAFSICRETLALSGRQCAYCDEIAVACAIEPMVIKEYKYLKACVELNGMHTKGQVACDWVDELLPDSERNSKSDNKILNTIKFVVSYDVHVVDKMICEAVKKADK